MRIPKKAIACIETISKLQQIEGESICDINSQAFERLTYAAQKAAKNAGLAFRAGCLHSGNNHQQCNCFFIPGSGSGYIEDGSNSYFWELKNTHFYKVEKVSIKSTSYNLILCGVIDGLYSYADLFDICHMVDPHTTISRTALLKFFKCYITELIRLDVISQSIHGGILGWFINPPNRLYHWEDKKIIHTEIMPGTSTDNLLPEKIFPADSIWFAASLFSLCKPLFALCRMQCNTHFALQILLNSSRGAGEEDRLGLWVLEHQARLWCNYRHWPKKAGNNDHVKFRNRFSQPPSMVFIFHRGFPVILFGFKRRDESYDPIEYWDRNNKIVITVNKRDLEYLCSGKCLSVLLPAFSPPKNYPKKLCLSLTVDMPAPDKFFDYYDIGNSTLRERHQNINSFYISCMNAISGQNCADVGKNLKKSYRKALADLGAVTAKKDIRKEQLACLLGTLYFLHDVLTAKGEKVERLNRLLQAFRREIGIVTLGNFSNFVRGLLHHPDENADIIFGQDKDGIYLFYKTYWPAFQKYCKSNGLVLSMSAQAFRKSFLIPKNLIRPQYAPSNGAYVRYDYRKKLNGKEATVLNLSHHILAFNDFAP